MAAPNRHILIADQDATSRDLLTMHLGLRGWDVTSCASLQETRDALDANAYDVLLLSEDLPDGKSLDLLRDIRPERPGMGIIMVSQRGSTEPIIRALEHGADDYLTRPLSPAVAVARVQSVLALSTDRVSTQRPQFLDLPSIDAHLRNASGGRAKLEAICDILRDGLHAERVSVFRLDRHGNELLSVVAHGDEDGPQLVIRIPADTGLSGACIQSEAMLNIPDAYQDDRFNSTIDEETGFRTGSVLCVPLHDQHGELVGVAQALNHTNGTFAASDEIIARQLAPRCAAALTEAFYADIAVGGLQLAATITLAPAILDLLDSTIAVSDADMPTHVLDDVRTMRDPDNLIGTSIGRYAVTSILGRGSQGVVLEGKDAFLERAVAIKLLGPDSANISVMRDQFMAEMRSMALLTHPNTVAVYDAGEHDGALFLVMEKCSDGTALARLKAEGRLPLQVATNVVRDACKGLDAAHRRGMVHRDIKPDNILLSEHDAKLSDFGLVLAHNQEGDGSGRIAGTPHYMSPEQCRGDAVDHRSDIYALGATLFHLATGEPPFANSRDVKHVMKRHREEQVRDPREIDPSLPPDMCVIVATAMAKDPVDRYQSAVEMLDDLDSLLAAARLSA